ncbi:unnamed protein product [Prorocentrum cordatum]|uniref:Uncharacterized protein n=1 Tax=Prorocentrum cordatum TaxID=2364126 RepID=A0ABN9TMQ0_9DINO|nr:unnamed protein product [Polarella glacialis]
MGYAYYVLIFALVVAISRLIHGGDALSQRLRSRLVGDLYAEDFAPSTVRIRSPGTHHIKEDIEFNPTGAHLSWSEIPEDSSTYPQNGGYIFSAALTAEADNVDIVDIEWRPTTVEAAAFPQKAAPLQHHRTWLSTVHCWPGPATVRRQSYDQRAFGERA